MKNFEKERGEKVPLNAALQAAFDITVCLRPWRQKSNLFTYRVSDLV